MFCDCSSLRLTNGDDRHQTITTGSQDGILHIKNENKHRSRSHSRVGRSFQRRRISHGLRREPRRSPQSLIIPCPTQIGRRYFGPVTSRGVYDAAGRQISPGPIPPVRRRIRQMETRVPAGLEHSVLCMGPSFLSAPSKGEWRQN